MSNHQLSFFLLILLGLLASVKSLHKKEIGDLENRNLQCNVNGLCLGTTVDVLESRTKSSCQKQCQKNEKCNWFSFSKEQNICVHLENCLSINENNKYVSGEENCIIPEYTKLLVTSGDPYGLPNTTEVIDLSNSENLCDSFPTYKCGGSFGGLINDEIPVVCGGHGYCDNNGCASVGDVIEVVGHMTNYHPNYNMYAASIVLNNELLWITGGLVVKLETNSTVLETTEYLDIANNDGKSYPGPNLPAPVYGHCLLQVNETTAFLMGGVNDLADIITKDTYFFNFDDQKWTPGPPMMYPLLFHGCALLKSHGRNIVVVAGDNTLSPAVQFLDLANTDEWFSGPDLPVALTHLAIVSFEDTVITVAGNEDVSGGFHQLKCDEELSCHWTTMAQKLKQGRYWPVAIKIPDELANCIESEK